jgi:hypothetical protein
VLRRSGTPQQIKKRERQRRKKMNSEPGDVISWPINHRKRYWKKSWEGWQKKADGRESNQRRALKSGKRWERQRQAKVEASVLPKDRELAQARTPSRVGPGIPRDWVSPKEEEDVELTKPGESVGITEETGFEAGDQENPREVGSELEQIAEGL